MITMHGPALDGSGETHQTEVHPDNVEAFKRSGWVEGPKEWSNNLGETSYTLEDSIEQLKDTPLEKTLGKKAVKKKGK
jgi:hypothetical protein